MALAEVMRDIELYCGLDALVSVRLCDLSIDALLNLGKLEWDDFLKEVNRLIGKPSDPDPSLPVDQPILL